MSKLVVSSCEKWVRNFEGVDAVVTDNASNMSLMKSLLQEETRLPDTDGNDEGSFRMIILPCFAHVLNLILKSFLSFPLCIQVLQKANMAVTFFKHNALWNDKLHEMETRAGLSHSLKLFCKTRWYSAVQTLRSVVDHESIFRAVTHPDSPGSHIPQHIDDIISDRKFFDQVDVILTACKPVVDSLANLEEEQTTLADCLLELIHMVSRLRKSQRTITKARGRFGHVCKCMNLRYGQYVTSYHILAIFFHPRGKELIKDEVTIKGMKRTFLNTLRKWEYSKTRVDWISQQFRAYRSGSESFQSTASTANAYQWWLNMCPVPENELLRAFALRLLAIVPTSVDAERLFSSLSAIHTKQRNRMNPSTLKQIAQIKSHLRSKAAPGKARKTKEVTKPCDSEEQSTASACDEPANNAAAATVFDETIVAAAGEEFSATSNTEVVAQAQTDVWELDETIHESRDVMHENENSENCSNGMVIERLFDVGRIGSEADAGAGQPQDDAAEPENDCKWDPDSYIESL